MTLTKISMLTLASFLFIHIAKAQTVPPTADEVIKEARAEAARTHKNIFIIFHASWCGWCRKMDDAMNDKKIKSFFDANYVIRHLTVDETEGKKNLENPGAAALRAQYHGDQQGIPFWLIFDKDGKLLADSRYVDQTGKQGNNVGCPAEPQEVEYFVKTLKNTSPLRDGELSLIQERFSKTKN